MKNESEQYSFNAGASLVCAIVLFLLSGCKIEISLYSLLMGLAFGVITMLNAIMNAKAIKIGPLGYTTVIVSLSTAITALSGAIFWHETLNIFKIIGIVLMLGCFVLAVDTDNKEGKKANNINNIQYVAFMMMVAKHCGLKPGKYTHFIQNVHLYDKHIPIAKEFLNRPISEKQPKLIFEPKSNNFFEFTIDDFRIEDYEPQPKVNIEIAI